MNNLRLPYTQNKCLTLNLPIATKVVCFSRLLKCLRSLYGEQCGPRSDCSYRSSLFWVHSVCFYIQFVRNVRQIFAADHFSRRHFQIHFFLGALRVKLMDKKIFIILQPKFLLVWIYGMYLLVQIVLALSSREEKAH